MNFLVVYFIKAHFKLIQNLRKLIIRVINIAHKIFSSSFVSNINLDYQILLFNVIDICIEGTFQEK